MRNALSLAGPNIIKWFRGINVINKPKLTLNNSFLEQEKTYKIIKAKIRKNTSAYLYNVS